MPGDLIAVDAFITAEWSTVVEGATAAPLLVGTKTEAAPYGRRLTAIHAVLRAISSELAEPESGIHAAGIGSIRRGFIGT